MICRTEKPLENHLKEKLALFTDLDPSEVIENMDADSLYEIPLMLEKQGLSKLVIDHLGLKTQELDLSHWYELIEKVKNIKGQVNIALVGKYVELRDAYISVVESLNHGGIENGVAIKIKWIQARDLDSENCQSLLEGMDGILVPGGFDDKGVDGKLVAIKYARENKVPYLGISLGMQLAVIDYARNVLELKGADSAEWNLDTEYPVIDLRPEQSDLDLQNDEIRLGLYPCKLKKGTRAQKIYDEDLIYERHMNRYEVSNEYKDRLIEGGLTVSGSSPDGRLTEIIELKDHPWFVGVNFHPEFKSRPTNPHPLFVEFIKAALDNRK